MQRSLSDPDYIELVASLRKRREARRLSQRALSEALGKPQSFVAKYETCERRLDVLEVLRVCRALDTSLRNVLPECWREEA
jgi:transcriptional regulator with XRE-family HTH domain